MHCVASALHHATYMTTMCTSLRHSDHHFRRPYHACARLPYSLHKSPQLQQPEQDTRAQPSAPKVPCLTLVPMCNSRESQLRPVICLLARLQSACHARPSRIILECIESRPCDFHSTFQRQARAMCTMTCIPLCTTQTHWLHATPAMHTTRELHIQDSLHLYCMQQAPMCKRCCQGSTILHALCCVGARELHSTQQEKLGRVRRPHKLILVCYERVAQACCCCTWHPSCST